MTHLGAATFGIAATVSLLVVYIGWPAPSAAIVERQAPIVAEGKSDRLLIPAAELPVEPPQPKPVAIVAPAAEPSIALPVEAPIAPLKPRADPVCGPRGRTWYTKDNGWRYWRCNR
jgi:hypothetical protein